MQSGKAEEFVNLEAVFFEELRKFFRDRLGYEPVMLAVPGNHDLDRKALERFPATTRCLLDPNEIPKIADLLFVSHEPGCESEYRLAVEAAFRNYTNWWDKNNPSVWKPERESKVIEFSADVGLMPGDFSATFQFRSPEGNQRMVGIVGLNTTFLQLAAGDFRGKLSWDPRQLSAVCGGDAPAWVKKHDACLLLTHQGPEWLTPYARREAMYEINPPGRFAVHIFGHEHELLIQSQATLGGPLRNSWQGASLFGLETYDVGPVKVERRHGYSAGKLDLDRAELRIWPRKAVLTTGSGWRFVPDREGCVLNEDDSLCHPIARVDNSYWQAMDLDRAQEDFTNQLRKFRPDDEIVVHHIGLDMSRAKDRLIVTLREPLRAKRITIMLLVLSKTPSDFPPNAPREVREWSRCVEDSVKYIKNEINGLDDEYKKQNRQLTIMIRPYAEVPNIHGFALIKKRVDGKDDRIATYFSFCRWGSNGKENYAQFLWGQDRYWQISQDRRDQLSEDMSAIFEGAFQHLWECKPPQAKKPTKNWTSQSFERVVGVE